MFYTVIKNIVKPFFFIYYNISIYGKENIPELQGYIVCGNHTRLVDPILLAFAFSDQIHFMAKEELFRNKILAWLIKKLGAFPIKRGKADLKSIKTSLRILKDNKNLGIFPEGTRNKTNELRAEPGIVLLAIKAKSIVVPVSIKSSYKAFSKTKIIIGKPIDLKDYYEQRLKNEDYTRISYDIMKKLKEL